MLMFILNFLIDVVHCAVKAKTNTDYANKFNKISKRRDKKNNHCNC